MPDTPVPSTITMNDTKPENARWISDVSKDDLASAVAVHSIRQRVRIVEHYLPLAATAADQDIEHVHQLRVATRRAVAAVCLYRPFLPKRPRKQLCQELKRIRRAAGAARDCDVMLLRHQQQTAEQPLECLVHDLRDRRAEAQQPLCDVYSHMTGQQSLTRLCEEAIADVEQKTAAGRSPRFGRWARRELRRSVRFFFAAEPHDLEDLSAIHQFRLAGKDLRYAIELLAAAFPNRLRERLYPVVEQLQERLGTVNDHAVAIERFREWREAADQPEVRKQYKKVIKSEQQQLAQALWDFARWWTPRRSKWVQRRFSKLLDT